MGNQRRRKPGRRIRSVPPHPAAEWLFCLLLGLILAIVSIRWTEHQYFPILQSLASAQISNTVTQQLSETITTELTRDVAYQDLIHLERDAQGNITAITSDMAHINQLKNQVVSTSAALLSQLSPKTFGVPVGSLTQIAGFSGRGARIPVQAVTVGTIQADFTQSFTEAGINQTRHRITLKLTVPLDILMSGTLWRETVTTELLIGETVIVGRVPETYLQVQNSNKQEGETIP